MRRARSGSSSTASWQLEADDAGFPPEQRRIRHLTGVLIRNLTSNPRRDHLSSLLHGKPTTSPDLWQGPSKARAVQFAADDTDLHFRTRRKRATTSASALQTSEVDGHGVYSNWAMRRSDSGEPAASTSSLLNTLAPAARPRSTSRASLMSVRTIGSSPTIRPTPEEDDVSSLIARPNYASDADLSREKDARESTLKKRLLDSFVTLRLVESPDATSPEVNTPKRTRLTRSSSSTTTLFRARLRSASNPPAFEPGPSASRPATYSPPFFVSEAQQGTMHPGFDVSPSDLLVDDVESWKGLQSSRVLVGVWTRTVQGRVEGKGKGKSVIEDDWSLLCEWDVALDGLLNIGRDPLHFPPLPPNALVIQLSDEYFTAPASSKGHPSFNPHSDVGSTTDEDDGNLSDPGMAALTARKQKSQAEQARRNNRIAVEKSRRETRMVRPADLETVARLVTLQGNCRQLRRSVSELEARTASLLDSGSLLQLHCSLLHITDVADNLEASKVERKASLKEEKELVSQRRRLLRERAERLREARGAEREIRQQLLDVKDGHDADILSCTKLRHSVHLRQTELVTLLSTIYPIEPSLDIHSPLLFTILDLTLPNSSYPASSSDDEISSALGYVALVLQLVSKYIGVPLNYPIQAAGSRSVVLDPISVMRGPRAFPLYGKGVEQYRFDYGVFLLNKNIEQLMYSQGLMVADLRNTLPNLKTLLLGLSFDPSRETPSSILLDDRASEQPVKDQNHHADIHNDDLLDDFTPPSPPKLSIAITGVLDNGHLSHEQEDETPGSPSTIRAASVRSGSPSTIRSFKLNGRGREEGEKGGKTSGVGGEAKEVLSSLVGKTGVLSGRGRAGSGASLVR